MNYSGIKTRALLMGVMPAIVVVMVISRKIASPHAKYTSDTMMLSKWKNYSYTPTRDILTTTQRIDFHNSKISLTDIQKERLEMSIKSFLRANANNDLSAFMDFRFPTPNTVMASGFVDGCKTIIRAYGGTIKSTDEPKDYFKEWYRLVVNKPKGYFCTQSLKAVSFSSIRISESSKSPDSYYRLMQSAMIKDGTVGAAEASDTGTVDTKEILKRLNSRSEVLYCVVYIPVTESNETVKLDIQRPLYILYGWDAEYANWIPLRIGFPYSPDRGCKYVF